MQVFPDVRQRCLAGDDDVVVHPSFFANPPIDDGDLDAVFLHVDAGAAEQDGQLLRINFQPCDQAEVVDVVALLAEDFAEVGIGEGFQFGAVALRIHPLLRDLDPG